MYLEFTSILDGDLVACEVWTNSQVAIGATDDFAFCHAVSSTNEKSVHINKLNQVKLSK
jgi:hypothetical protein